MKILVTGAKGFIGKNLCLTLKSLHLQKNHPLANETIELLECDIDTPREQLETWLETCDFVYHLAGVNRPKDVSEFKTGNTVFTEDILERLGGRSVGGGLGRRSGSTMEERNLNSAVDLETRPRPIPILLASSTQAALDNDYGKSKKAAEDAVFAYGEKTGAPVYVYRFANVFGKWCRPNYNSAVATWCYNIAHDLPIMVRDPNAQVTLIYIDDLVEALVGHLVEIRSRPRSEVDNGEKNLNSAVDLDLRPRPILSITPSYTKTLGEITDLLYSFRNEPENLMVPDQADGFTKKLYSTYLSYLPEDKFSYPVTMHCDERGSFTELLHTAERGQVSVNISKPGITKGQHWHHTKHEKFCVVSGRGCIQFRKMDNIHCSTSNRQPSTSPIIEYHVSGEKIEVVRIPPGYTHNIINEGDADMVTLMWANEVFDPQRPDTYREPVVQKRIGITGQTGFVGGHLAKVVQKSTDFVLVPFKNEFFEDEPSLRDFVKSCDVIVHLAAVTRSSDEQELYDTNMRLVRQLIDAMEAERVTPLVMLSSSIHETRDIAYGRSKKEGGDLLADWATRTGGSFLRLIFPNVFGPDARPFYCSVIANFCYQLTHGMEPEIQVDAPVRLVYVKNLCRMILEKTSFKGVGRIDIPWDGELKVSALLALFRTYKELKGSVPQLDAFRDDLLATFNSYWNYRL